MTPAAGAGRVLVVDDERMNRMLLERSLRAEGHEVITAADGREALDAVARDAPDLVLLDLVMPEMDGYEVLAKIRSDPATAHVPVIVISAVDDLASVVRCIEMGAMDYLPKPFEPTLLRARLRSGLTGKRLRDLELEYLEQVARVTGAATALELGAFEPVSLEEVGRRDDALGLLARSFVAMAREVRAREEALRAEVRELRIEIDEARQASRVAEITGSDYFQSLRHRAASLRQAIDGGDAGEDDPRMPGAAG